MTEPLPHAYIFLSADGMFLALSVTADGSNLPKEVQWKPRQAVPMTPSSLAAHVSNPHIVMTNLIMRGYHLVRLSADIVPLPAPHRSST